MEKVVQKILPTKLDLLKRKKVAAYARVSSGKDAMINSLSAQISYYSEYIQSCYEWDYAGVYADEAISGTKDSRPEFQRMIKDSSRGAFDLVIVWKLDRFARNRYDSAHYKAILKKNRVKVISATESISRTLPAPARAIAAIASSSYFLPILSKT